MFIPLKDVNPTRHFPYVTVFLIAVNCLVFLYQALSPNGLDYSIIKMGAIPYEITHFTRISGIPRISPVAALFTSMFLHGNLFHLLGNMLYLWIFGNNIEDHLGPLRYIFFYFISGLGASMVHILLNFDSTTPVIGASGAIAGILGAYLILYPHARVMTFVFLIFIIRIIPVPAVFLLGIWFIGQLLSVGLGGGVAWFAHIGGFLLGIFLIKQFDPGRPGVSVE